MSIDDSTYKHCSGDCEEDTILNIVFWKKIMLSSATKIIKLLSRYLMSKTNNANDNSAKQIVESPKFGGASQFMREFEMYSQPNQDLQNQQHLIESRVDPFKLRKTKLQTFRQVFRLHNQTHMLITVSNKSVEAFVPVMTTVGMSICIVCNFTMIHVLNYLKDLVNDVRNGSKEYTRHIQEIIIIGYLAIAVMFILDCIIVGIVIFFCKHASQPRLHFQKYIHIWRNCQLLPKLEKRQARAMREICFMLGTFFKASEDTALRILHKILDLTITMLLGLS